MAGANLIYGAGMLESGVTFDYGQFVMDNELIKMIRRFVEGIVVNDETLAIDEIVAVGSQGDFLGTDHTMHHLHDMVVPRLFDRQVRVEWETAGATDLATRCTAEARRVLAEYEPLPLSSDVIQEMDAIMAHAEQEIAAGAPA